LFTGPSQLLIVVLNRNSAEFGLTIAAIPIVLFLLAACGVALQREIKWCAIFYYQSDLVRILILASGS
jgi:hypothetical protein